MTTTQPLTDTDIRDLSRDDLLVIAQRQRPNWQKTTKYPFNLDRRLGVDKLRRLLLDPDERFTTTPSAPSQEPLQLAPESQADLTLRLPTIQSGLPSGTKKLVVKIIDARFQKHHNRAYTLSVAVNPSRQGCRPGDWNVASQAVVEALKEEPGAQRIIDGPYRLSTPLVEGSDFFEDFLVEKTYRQVLLRVPHHNEILIKVEEAQALDDIQQLHARLIGAKRKLLSESGAKPEAEFTEMVEGTVNERAASDDDGDHTDSVYPLVRARGRKTPSHGIPSKKLRKSSHASKYSAEDESLTSLLRQQIRKDHTSLFKTFLEHHGCLKLSNSQIIDNWQFGVDICNEYHKRTIPGTSQRIDYKHIYGALGCSETWLRDARNYINLVSMYASPFTGGTTEIAAKLESTEVSTGGRKDLIAYLRSLQQNSKETDKVLASGSREA